MYWGGESIGEGDDEGGGGDDSEDVYNGKTKPALVSVSDSYSEDEAISISNSRYSSYLAYTATDYFYKLTTVLRKGVYNFDLRRSFYSK